MLNHADHEKRQAMDTLIREQFADALDPGEVITAWLTIAGTMDAEGGGTIVFSTSGVPHWQLRGLARTLLQAIESMDDDAQHDDEGGVA